jgi:hypothetical protein
LVAIVGDNDAVTGPLQHVHVSIVVDDQDLGRGPVFPPPLRTQRPRRTTNLVTNSGAVASGSGFGRV